jgi:prephenate dehydrogenase
VPDRFLPVVGSTRPLPPFEGPPPFDRIAIVGLGLIGGSIALAARQRWPAGLVIGVDAKDVLEKAMVLQAVDVAADDLVVVKEADLVVLAAPVRQNLTRLAQLDAHVPGAAVVTDTGSTKRATVDAARILPGRLAFVGGHPLAGAARGGIEFARADLFVGRPWLFTPGPSAPVAARERLERFASALGAVPRTIDAEAHDRVLAFLSHLPQLTASALMQVVGEAVGADWLALAGHGLRDTTRLATSPAGVWRDICATNADQVAEAIDRLVAALLEMRADLEAGDALERIFSAAAEWKSRLPSE